MPIGHIGLNVHDLAQAQRYYDELMPLLDMTLLGADESQVAYCPADGKRGAFVFLYRANSQRGYDRTDAGLQHLAFMVPTRSAVHAVHAFVVSHRGNVVHEPQTFPQYPQPYFATFWADPFGFYLEAVCHHDRP